MTNRGQKRVLIVDDEVGLRDLLKFRLCAFGFDVLIAEDGYEGFETAKSEIPDLIILDIMLPYLNGYELCKKLKADARTRHIPVVILTVLAQKEDIAMGQTVGAEFFLTKPYDPEKLNAVLKMALQKSNAADGDQPAP